MRCFTTFNLQLGLLEPRASCDITANQRRCQPDRGFMPFSQLQVRAFGEPKQNHRMR